MTPTQFREALAALGLSQLGAARLWGINPRTVRRWAKNGPPQIVGVLLAQLLHSVGVTPPGP
jgi:hypothetical protein